MANTTILVITLVVLNLALGLFTTVYGQIGIDGSASTNQLTDYITNTFKINDELTDATVKRLPISTIQEVAGSDGDSSIQNLAKPAGETGSWLNTIEGGIIYAYESAINLVQIILAIIKLLVMGFVGSFLMTFSDSSKLFDKFIGIILTIISMVANFTLIMAIHREIVKKQ